MRFVIHKIKRSNIVLQLTFLLIFFGLYVRDIRAYVEIQPVYFSLISAVLILLLLLPNMKLPKRITESIVFLFFLSFMVSYILSIMIGALLYQEYTSLYINYLMQIFAMIAVFLSAYLMISSGTVNCKQIAFMCFFSGFLLIFYTFFDLLGAHSVRRIQLLGAKNYIAYSLSISIISGMFLLGETNTGLRKIKELVIFFGLVFLIVTLILTGSRGAILGLLVSTGLLLLFYNGLRLKIFISSIFFIGSLFTFLVMPHLIDVRALFSRFSSDMLLVGSSSRYSQWMEVFNYIGSTDVLLLGKAHLYYGFSVSDFQPHNYFLSVMMYGGILPSMFSLFAIMTLMVLLFYKAVKSKKDEVAVGYSRNDNIYFFSIFVIMLFFLFLSGNVTKMVNVFFVLGACLGIVARRPYGVG